jgi:hypothetical protein
MRDIKEKIEYIYHTTDGIYYFLLNDDVSDHSKRCVSRRFFILVDSYLEIIGFFKNNLFNENKINLITKQTLESEIKDISKEWINNYEIIRNKISAHQQDVDELKLLEWWNEIDYTTISFFYEGMRKIRNILTNENTILTITPVDFSQINFSGTCLQKQKDSKFYLAHDRLALTKKNTVSLIGSTEFQRKCMLVLSIVDFIFIDCDVTIKTQNYDTYYKEIMFGSAWLLIACDTISLIDHLYEDSEYGASLLNVCPQDWKGLPILEESNLKRNNEVEISLAELRNKFAAHIDTSEQFQVLITLFSKFNLQEMHRYCMLHMQAFQRACLSDIRSKMFTSLDQTLQGNIISISHSGHTSIDS